MRTYVILSTLWNHETLMEEPTEVALVTQDLTVAKTFYHKHKQLKDIGELTLSIWEDGKELEIDEEYRIIRTAK